MVGVMYGKEKSTSIAVSPSMTSNILARSLLWCTKGTACPKEVNILLAMSGEEYSFCYYWLRYWQGAKLYFSCCKTITVAKLHIWLVIYCQCECGWMFHLGVVTRVYLSMKRCALPVGNSRIHHGSCDRPISIAQLST